MSYRLIQNELDNILSSVDDLPRLVKENEISYNVSDQQNSIRDSEYVRSTLLPATTIQTSISKNGTDEFNGLYQIDIFTSPTDGVDRANFLVDEIITAFTLGTHTNDSNICLRINNYSRETGITSSNFYSVSVVIDWSCYKQRPL